MEAAGGWNKGALTTSLCLFIQHLSTIWDLANHGDEVSRLIVSWQDLTPFWHKVSDRVCNSSSKLKSHEQKASSSRALNAWIRMLHSGEAWLSRHEANRTNLAGRHFLDCYGRLAHICHSRSELKFGLVPKVHMLWHIIHNMIVQTHEHSFCENPLSESCSIDEDFIYFIGKFCQLTRSVKPQAASTEGSRTISHSCTVVVAARSNGHALKSRVPNSGPCSRRLSPKPKHNPTNS